MKHINVRTAVASTIALGILGSGMALAPAAFASHGGGGVRASGACSATGTWKLKAKTDDANLEVEAEVDVNTAGQQWNWTLADNGTVVQSGTSTTAAPSGSFTVNRLIANSAGTDKLTFKAKTTGNACTGKVSI